MRAFSVIRTRLLGLVISASAPFVALIATGFWDQWKNENTAFSRGALGEARLIAAQVDDHIGNLDNLLTGLSGAVLWHPSDREANDALLRRTKLELPDFISQILFFSPDGTMIGSSQGGDGVPIYAGDRPFFRKVVAGQPLVIGDVLLGRASGRWIVTVARRVEDQGGQLIGVLSIGTFLEYFPAALRLQTLPAKSVVRIVNEDGIVIVQSVDGPKWIGRDLSNDTNVMQHIAARETSEVTRWPDDIERITGSSTMHRAPWLVSVGFPKDIALAAVASRLGWSALLSTVALIAAFGIAWILSGRIVRPLQELRKQASVLAAGELSHRSTINSKDELGDLASTFNVMADSLQQRYQETQRASDELRQARNALAALIENIPVPIVVKELNELRFTLVNQAYEKFIGISRDQIIGRTIYDLFAPEDARKIEDRDKEAITSAECIVGGEFTVQTPHNGLRTVKTIRLVVDDSDSSARQLVAVIEDITERRRAEETILRMAHHDPLTGLLNRG